MVVLVFTSFFWILNGGGGMEGGWGVGWRGSIPLVRVYQVRHKIGEGTGQEDQLVAGRFGPRSMMWCFTY